MLWLTQPKRKKTKSSGEGSRSKRSYAPDDESDAEMYGGDEQAWVPAETPNEVNGPSFIYQRLEGGSVLR